MNIDRRRLLSAGLGAGAGLAATGAVAAPRADRSVPGAHVSAAVDAGLVPDSAADQTAKLQDLIDQAARRRAPLVLPPGKFLAGALTLRPGTRISGSGPATILQFLGGNAFITAENAADVLIECLVIDGDLKPLNPARATGLIALKACRNLTIRDVEVRRSLIDGLSLAGAAGRVTGCRIGGAARTGIFSVDAAGLEIAQNVVADCRNNGIQVWRSAKGEDGTIVTGNRIERIAAMAGGSGENGNGINVFRAGNVLVTGNRISDCAYSAIRGNAASNIQMVANNCQRLGEVALYAEFGFEGALIASNLVDTAAMGISVTNFNEGGRLAVIQGNLVRNLFRREQEPKDKRGEGIGVEADATVSGNTIENAPTAGIVIGWGRHMREVAVTGNLIRAARVGIAVTTELGSGACLIAQNMISGHKAGAIRASDYGRMAGPDLAQVPPANGRLTVVGNMSIGGTS